MRARAHQVCDDVLKQQSLAREARRFDVVVREAVDTADLPPHQVSSRQNRGLAHGSEPGLQRQAAKRMAQVTNGGSRPAQHAEEALLRAIQSTGPRFQPLGQPPGDLNRRGKRIAAPDAGLITAGVLVNGR